MHDEKQLRPNKFINPVDLEQLLMELNSPQQRDPSKFPDPQGVRNPGQLAPAPGFGGFRDQQVPMMNFLQWLLSKGRGAMWGQPDRPDELLDLWLRQNMNKPL